MADNDFLPWATAGGANVDSQATFAARPEVATGVVSGTALSSLYNKATRQANSWAHVLGQIIVDQLAVNATDDGNVAILETNFLAAIAAYVGSASLGSGYAVATGAVNTPAITIAALTGAPPAGFRVWVKMNHTNTAGVTLTVNGNAPVAVHNRDGSALVANQLLNGGIYLFEFDGSIYQALITNIGNGLAFNASGNIVAALSSGLVFAGSLIEVAVGSGIEFDGSGNVTVFAGNGLNFSGGALQLHLTPSGGLDFDGSGRVEVANVAAGASIATPKGHYTTPNGLIFQWGRVSFNTGDANVVDILDTVFPNAAFAVFANPRNEIGALGSGWISGNSTTTQVTIAFNEAGATAPQPFSADYLVIGN